MLECFLLLRHVGAKWVPVFAIPGIVAGFAASICLILSGIKGIIASTRQSKPRSNRSASPEHAVQWIARRPAPNGNHR